MDLIPSMILIIWESRVKCVGEMVENVFRVGLVRVEKAVKERMTTMELSEKLQPKDIVNSKPITAPKEFLVLVSYHSLWIRIIHLPRLLIKEESLHLVQEV